MGSGTSRPEEPPTKPKVKTTRKDPDPAKTKADAASAAAHAAALAKAQDHRAHAAASIAHAATRAARSIAVLLRAIRLFEVKRRSLTLTLQLANEPDFCEADLADVMAPWGGHFANGGVISMPQDMHHAASLRLPPHSLRIQLEEGLAKVNSALLMLRTGEQYVMFNDNVRWCYPSRVTLDTGFSTRIIRMFIHVYNEVYSSRFSSYTQVHEDACDVSLHTRI